MLPLRPRLEMPALLSSMIEREYTAASKIHVNASVIGDWGAARITVQMQEARHPVLVDFCARHVGFPAHRASAAIHTDQMAHELGNVGVRIVLLHPVAGEGGQVDAVAPHDRTGSPAAWQFGFPHDVFGVAPFERHG